MQALGQPRLFQVRNGQGALDAELAARGHAVVDPVHVYLAPVEAIATERPPRVTAFCVWEPLAIQIEFWAASGIGPGRIAVMQRAAGPKTALLGRLNDHPAGAGFVAIHDGIAMVHAENGDVVAELQAKLMAEGNTGPEAHAYSRPPQVEGEAANRAIMIADMAGVPLYIVHVSCEEAHEAIRRARQQGKRVWGEPLIQHLTLDEGEYFNQDWDHAARRVMSPPFRNKAHQDSLWAGLMSGSLSVVATDHCAFTTAQKRFGVGDFTKIPNGTGGLEDRMPMLWTHGVGTGRLTLNEFVAVTSTNIAKILNCYPRKGAVLVGADADLVVWDPDKTKTITAGAQQSAIDYNVFEGKEVKGLPRFTLTRGQVAVHDGEIRTQEGHGQFVARAANAPVNTALSAWKELTNPRPVVRSGIPASGV